MAGTRPSSPTESSRITIPKLNRDPIQSLSPCSVFVRVGQQEVEIPPLPAVEWLTVLMAETPDLDDIFPGFLSTDDADLVDQLIIDGELSFKDFEEIIHGIIETISGRQWWVALRLIEVARVSWDVLGGELALRGVDARQISLSSWLDVLLLVTIRSQDPKDVTMFTMKLEAPPPDTEVQEPEMAASDFMSMA